MSDAPRYRPKRGSTGGWYVYDSQRDDSLGFHATEEGAQGACDVYNSKNVPPLMFTEQEYQIMIDDVQKRLLGARDLEVRNSTPLTREYMSTLRTLRAKLDHLPINMPIETQT